MQVHILDGDRITDKKILHDILADDMNFPEWYGRNLDALYDCLSDVQKETRIEVRNSELLEEHLGKYSERLLQVLHRVSKENPRIHVCIEKK